jgi:zinc protease
MPRLKKIRACLAGVLLALAQPASAAEASATAASPWPALATDLPADPNLTEGTLPNGLRYLILPNAEPKDHVSLRLLVAVGSLHENDDERGLAHFIEHMAFRGTRAFPDGAMTAAFQRLGVAFGPDNTAFTTFDHTIYHLELPDGGDAMLRQGLRAFREYADAVTFDPRLIERERGVVLSEMATRDTPDSRASDSNLAFLWPAAREVRRKTIGEAAAIRTFQPAQFVAFYNAWYRPERMAVILVGAVEPASAARLIAEQFGSLAARAPARPEPADLLTREAARPDVRVFSDPGLIGVSIALQHPRFMPRAAATHAERVQRLHEALAFAMLHARLQKLAAKEDASFVGPRAAIGDGLPQWQIATVGLNTRISDWRGAAMDLEREHRRAYQFGFTARELAEARAAFVTGYEQSVRSAPTRPSPWLAQQLVAHMLQGQPFSTPAAVQRDIADDLTAATLADCAAAFRAAWSNTAPSVFLAANPAFNITRAQIAATLNESRAADVTAPVETAALEFAYTDFGPPGRLVREQHLDDLDVRLTEFANGVRLNFKATPFEADTVDLHVRVGDGKLSQLKSRPGLDLLASTALSASGVGRHTAIELREILSSHALGLAFRVESDACVFGVRCARRELGLACQVIAAFLTDAAYRPEAMRDVRANFNTMYAALAASPSGPVAMQAMRAVFSDDGRFGIPGFEELYARDLGELAAWLDPQFKRGPIEMSVVGDVSWEEASAAVARTLGALPDRARRTAETATIPLVRAQPSPNYTLYSTPPGVKQLAVTWIWPVGTVEDIHIDRREHLLAEIVEERLRVRLREELGATYAPSARFEHLSGFQDGDCFVLGAELEPAHAKQAVQILQREIAALQKNGPTEDEFNRLKTTFIRQMTDSVRTNAYWGITLLSDAQQNPSRIAAARDRASDIVAIKREEIAALARQQLDPAKAFRFGTAPAPAPPPTTPAPATPAVQFQEIPVAELDALPAPISQKTPSYPIEMAGKKTAGDVVVEFFVEPDGSVQEAKAIMQTNEFFGRAAVDTVKQWKFKPGLKNGRAVRCRMRVPISFAP